MNNKFISIIIVFTLRSNVVRYMFCKLSNEENISFEKLLLIRRYKNFNNGNNIFLFASSLFAFEYLCSMSSI